MLLVSKERGAKERSSVVLEGICGLEAGGSSEGVACTLTILSLNQIVQLGFDSKEALLAWDLRLRYYLGEGEYYCVLAITCIFSDNMVFSRKEITYLNLLFHIGIYPVLIPGNLHFNRNSWAPAH